METVSVVADQSLNASSSSYESTKGAHWEKPDDKACENSESRRLAHGKGVVEEDDNTAPKVLDPTWMASIEKKLLVQPKRIKVSSSKFSTSIHKVPDILFQKDKNAYVPHVVSIGPLHYHKRRGKLQAVEEHKWRYLNKIVSRKGKAWFEKCIEAVKKQEEEARECYSQVIELDSNSFVEMMVLDGCFIIELFRKNLFRQFEDDHDPLFELLWLNSELMMDLLLLENQIPFFILQTLFDLFDISCSSLKEAALKFFGTPYRDNNQPKIERAGSSNHHIHHLLDLLHKDIVLSTENEYPPANDVESIHCASKLQESGIKFKKSNAGNFLDIKFDKEKGIIEIPRIYLGDLSNTKLRNLIAFEQCYLHCKKYITTYTYFMDCLINSSKDVEILVQKGIVKNELGSDEDVALLFNSINKELFLFHESYYPLGICKEINHYCRTPWPKLRATLMHDYFKNPWAVVSFLAAVLLLLFAMTQSFFSMFPKFAVGK